MKKKSSKKNEVGEGFSSIDLVCQCLIDQNKFRSFEAALRPAITKNSLVLDVGTGSGILAMLAARLGARAVTAIEFDPYIADVAKQNIQQNNLDKIIKVVTADARDIKFSHKTKFDIIIMEMLATGLVDEMQVQAINNLYNQGIITPKTIIIPFAQENYISLAQTNFSIYKFNMKMVRHLWSHDNNKNLLNPVTDKILLNKIYFSQKNNEIFSKQFTFKISQEAKINSLCLTSRIIVEKKENNILESTHSLNPIVLIPLPERRVKIGDIISININYRLGGGFNNFNVKFIN